MSSAVGSSMLVVDTMLYHDSQQTCRLFTVSRRENVSHFTHRCNFQLHSYNVLTGNGEGSSICDRSDVYRTVVFLWCLYQHEILADKYLPNTDWLLNTYDTQMCIDGMPTSVTTSASPQSRTNLYFFLLIDKVRIRRLSQSQGGKSLKTPEDNGRYDDWSPSVWRTRSYEDNVCIMTFST